jgi:hypothetical protein
VWIGNPRTSSKANANQLPLRQGLPLGSQEVTRLDELRGDEERGVYLRQAPARASEGNSLMLGLLRQPGGFERCLPGKVDMDLRDLSLADVPDIADRLLDSVSAAFDAAPLVE